MAASSPACHAGPPAAAPLPFASRRALMPMWGQAVLPSESWPAAWNTIAATPLPERALVYVHIPFCANHCVFCGFYRNGWNAGLAEQYVDRLVADIEAEAARRPAGGSIAAVYLGGGTPTLLPAGQLTRLLQTLRRCLPLAPDCEITVEGRMSHFDAGKVDACLAAGANRFSIGVQTFDSAIRRRLGRKHAGDEAAAYLAWLARHSQAVVVTDLIFGLPGQTEAVWQRDLDTALSLGLSGIDVYAFNLYPHLPVNRMIEKGALPPAPGLAEVAAQYGLAHQAFTAAGWEQLSNSHFGAPGRGERNRYNRAIKSGATCLAFGAGAGGNHAGLSYAVEPDVTGYIGTAGSKPLARLARLGEHHGWVSRLQGDVEAGRLDPAVLPHPEQLAGSLARWQDAGLVTPEPAGTGWQLTPAGRFWGPTLTRAVVDTMIPPSADTMPPHAMMHMMKRKEAA